MDLVDEQHRLGQLPELREHGLEELLENRRGTWCRDQCAEVEREDRRVGEDLGHLAVDDALGQALGDRGLAHARLAHVQRVVLAAAAQHLDGALHLVGAADQRVDLAVARQLVQVDRELGQGVRLPVPLAVAGAGFAVFLGMAGFVAVARDAVREVVDDVEPRTSCWFR